MKLFEGKTKAERNKIIAAIGLGICALIVLFYAFGGSIFPGSSSKTVTVKVSPTPTPAVKPGDPPVAMPSETDQMLDMTTQPIVYNPGAFGAPDPGRNIFAFYEPGLPTPYVPTPVPLPPTPKPATPEPTPPMQVAMISPASVYAGSGAFRMEISGDKFTPDTRIYIDQQEIPANFVNEQRMTADISAAMLRSEGQRQVLLQTLDGTKRSNPILFEVQPPPKPQFQYIGMIKRMRANNDTAYFKEPNRELPISARLNDVIASRFRLVSISAEQVVLQDISLDFNRVTLPLFVPPPGSLQPSSIPPGVPPGRRTFPGGREVYVPVNPTLPQGGQPPGMPNNVPRYQTGMPANTNRVTDQKDDGPNEPK